MLTRNEFDILQKHVSEMLELLEKINERSLEAGRTSYFTLAFKPIYNTVIRLQGQLLRGEGDLIVKTDRAYYDAVDFANRALTEQQRQREVMRQKLLNKRQEELITPGKKVLDS